MPSTLYTLVQVSVGAGAVLRSVSGCASAQGQLQEAPSALRLVPDPACSLGDPILASPSLQVNLPFFSNPSTYLGSAANVLHSSKLTFCSMRLEFCSFWNSFDHGMCFWYCFTLIASWLDCHKLQPLIFLARQLSSSFPLLHHQLLLLS